MMPPMKKIVQKSDLAQKRQTMPNTPTTMDRIPRINPKRPPPKKPTTPIMIRMMQRTRNMMLWTLARKAGARMKFQAKELDL